MFDLDSKKKEVKEGLLEKLIDAMMSTPDAKEDCEDVGAEVSEVLGEAKPKAKIEILEVEAKPKAKFKLGDGSEQEDESIEELLERKKKEKLEA